ncbi:hypothetical protein DF268_06190 [Streptomyces sp. V2]|nr:hypothetical protein DF268_06190 [Streptomyces sp. V2]QZZ32444.1 hypothetical protein A7X85_00780 [Streptomyces sp. ST1015]
MHTDSGGIYGSPRVHAVLKREGTRVGGIRVHRARPSWRPVGLTRLRSRHPYFGGAGA